MIESIEEIARKIERHRDLELKTNISNSAVGRSSTNYNNEAQQFWLINKQATLIKFLKDFNGNIIPQSGYSANPTYTADGFPVPRDSKLGELLILNHEGIHTYKTEQGWFEIEIFNRATYKPSELENEYATDIVIRLANDNQTYSFQDISKILSLQKEINAVKKQLEEATNEEAKLLIERIELKEEEKKSYLNKAQSFIRKYAELRYQPILDPIQESTKRSKIFDGTLIINGGPGTGKTTSLIQRIKFLISPSIEEYKTFTQTQKEILFNQKNSWIFYSPNLLLALFLRNSMKAEELNANTESVKVWSSHKNELIKTYRYVSDKKRPFLVYNKAVGISLFSNSSKSIIDITKGLDDFYIKFQREKLNRVSEVDVKSFKWRLVGLSIQKYVNERTDIKNIEDLILLYINLTSNFKKEVDDIVNEYGNLIKTIVSRIQVAVQKDEIKLNLLSEIFIKWKTESQEPEDEDDDDVEIEREDFDEQEELVTVDFERDLYIKLKALCRKQALKKFDKSIRFSKRERELSQIIPEVVEQNEYHVLGQTAFFKKFFERITKGIVANIFREIPMVYKQYRRQELNLKSTNWVLTLLSDLVKKDKNSRIHSDEQALLLLFANTVTLKLAKLSPEEFKSINHPYVTGFKNNCKAVIGIDEATDFSIIDLISMNSFGNPLISSTTLSGDIMQRMTTDGITSWDDFTRVIPGCEIKNLRISYRQSPTLLSLAKSIYKKSTGRTASYESYIESDKAEPKPLVFISEVEDKKIEWIADRIVDIYSVYRGSIPSIAIFLPEESQLERFANKLGGQDTLSDIGINVKACRDGEILGDRIEVRVFSINVIKGLEFESVFFHNMDSLQTQKTNEDLFLKYLYVGLSRATFYIGVTLSHDLPRKLLFIEDQFDKTGRTWIL